MNDLMSPAVVRAISLVASVAITTLIVSVHAADLATLGAHDVAVGDAHAIAQLHPTAQPPRRIALAASAAR